ncbi:hypothetical protein ONZ51_g5894 [Trametes cubensis]|uniref:Uncharacterized protein n=1 Tax=Trametes cubensis TaxID=1111947 RepID=A0AAD7XAI5_9APHY|nr:hypothetical protein ONZ51_g5894 [Trametes cubensis]
MVCQDTLVREYPQNLIPSSVVIPAWAYLDLTHDDKFDVASAEEEVTQASSSNADPPASTSPSTSGTTVARSTTLGSHTTNRSQLPTSTASQSGQGSEPGLGSSASANGLSISATVSKTGIPTTSQSQASSVTNSSEASGGVPAPMPSPTAASGETSNIQTGTHASATGEPAVVSIAVIVGPVVGGVTALALAVCGVVTVIVCSRKGRHRQIGSETVDDSTATFQELRDPASASVQQPLPEPPAPQIPRSPQDSERPAALPPRVPEIMMNLYDPDDPATYPPPLSVIHGRPITHRVTQGWDVPPDDSP